MHEKTNFCMNYPIGSLYGIFPYTFYHRTQLIVALNNTSPIDPVDIYHIFLDPLWVLPLSSLEVARRTETTCNFKPTNIDLNNILRLLPGQIMSFWTSSTNTTVPFWKGCWRSFSFTLIIWDIPKHRTCWKGDMWYWGNDVAFFIQKAETKTGCLWHTHTQTHTFLGVSQARQHTATKFFFASRISGLSININHHFWKNKQSPQNNYHLPGTQTKKIPSFDWHFALVLAGWFASPKIFRTSPSSHRCPGPVPGHKLPKLHPNLRASRSGDLQNGQRRKRGVFFWLKQLQ